MSDNKEICNRDHDKTWCEELCEKKPGKFIKTPLCGCIEAIVCGEIIIYSGYCFPKSFGTITITNQGECDVLVCKNGNIKVATIAPNASMTINSCPFNEIKLKTKGKLICVCWKGCVCDEICC